MTSIKTFFFHSLNVYRKKVWKLNSLKVRIKINYIFTFYHQLHDLEQQKQQQMALLWQTEQQKQHLEANLRQAWLQQQQGETQMQERLSSDVCNVQKQMRQEHEQVKDCFEISGEKRC